MAKVIKRGLQGALLLGVLAFMLITLSFACANRAFASSSENGEIPFEVEPVPATSITLFTEYNNKAIKPGDTLQFEVNLNPHYTTDLREDVRFALYQDGQIYSETSNAVIDCATGLMTVKSSARISDSIWVYAYIGNVYATYELEIIKIAVESITVNAPASAVIIHDGSQEIVQITAGESMALTHQIVPANASYKNVTYSLAPINYEVNAGQEFVVINEYTGEISFKKSVPHKHARFSVAAKGDGNLYSNQIIFEIYVKTTSVFVQANGSLNPIWLTSSAGVAQSAALSTVVDTYASGNSPIFKVISGAEYIAGEYVNGNIINSTVTIKQNIQAANARIGITATCDNVTSLVYYINIFIPANNISLETLCEEFNQGQRNISLGYNVMPSFASIRNFKYIVYSYDYDNGGVLTGTFTRTIDSVCGINEAVQSGENYATIDGLGLLNISGSLPSGNAKIVIRIETDGQSGAIYDESNLISLYVPVNNLKLSSNAEMINANNNEYKVYKGDNIEVSTVLNEGAAASNTPIYSFIRGAEFVESFDGTTLIIKNIITANNPVIILNAACTEDGEVISDTIIFSIYIPVEYVEFLNVGSLNILVEDGEGITIDYIVYPANSTNKILTLTIEGNYPYVKTNGSTIWAEEGAETPGASFQVRVSIDGCVYDIWFMIEIPVKTIELEASKTSLGSSGSAGDSLTLSTIINRNDTMANDGSYQYTIMQSGGSFAQVTGDTLKILPGVTEQYLNNLPKNAGKPYITVAVTSLYDITKSATINIEIIRLIDSVTVKPSIITQVEQQESYDLAGYFAVSPSYADNAGATLTYTVVSGNATFNGSVITVSGNAAVGGAIIVRVTSVEGKYTEHTLTVKHINVTGIASFNITNQNAQNIALSLTGVGDNAGREYTTQAYIYLNDKLTINMNFLPYNASNKGFTVQHVAGDISINNTAITGSIITIRPDLTVNTNMPVFRFKVVSNDNSNIYILINVEVYIQFAFEMENGEVSYADRGVANNLNPYYFRQVGSNSVKQPITNLIWLFEDGSLISTAGGGASVVIPQSWQAGKRYSFNYQILGYSGVQTGFASIMTHTVEVKPLIIDWNSATLSSSVSDGNTPLTDSLGRAISLSAPQLEVGYSMTIIPKYMGQMLDKFGMTYSIDLVAANGARIIGQTTADATLLNGNTISIPSGRAGGISIDYRVVITDGYISYYFVTNSDYASAVASRSEANIPNWNLIELSVRNNNTPTGDTRNPLSLKTNTIKTWRYLPNSEIMFTDNTFDGESRQFWNDARINNSGLYGYDISDFEYYIVSGRGYALTVSWSGINKYTILEPYFANPEGISKTVTVGARIVQTYNGVYQGTAEAPRVVLTNPCVYETTDYTNFNNTEISITSASGRYTYINGTGTQKYFYITMNLTNGGHKIYLNNVNMISPSDKSAIYSTASNIYYATEIIGIGDNYIRRAPVKTATNSYTMTIDVGNNLIFRGISETTSNIYVYGCNGPNGQNGKDGDNSPNDRKGGYGSNGGVAVSILFDSITVSGKVNVYLYGGTGGDGGKGGNSTAGWGKIGTAKDGADGGDGGYGGSAIWSGRSVSITVMVSEGASLTMQGGLGGKGGAGGKESQNDWAVGKDGKAGTDRSQTRAGDWKIVY